jgi:hypothetical protein
VYGLTRATLTVLGVAAVGVLIWVATRIVGDSIDTNGDYWVFVLLLAASGLTIALSQLLGGWTKWGWPRISPHVFLFAFLPVLVAVGWVLLRSQPHGNWGRNHVASWSDDIGIGGLVGDFTRAWQALALIGGLVFGLTFDTTGPRLRRALVAEETPPAGPAPPPAEPPPPDRPQP